MIGNTNAITELESIANQEATAIIEMVRETTVGNLDEGETTSRILLDTFSRRYALGSVFGERNRYGIRPAYISCLLEEEKTLLPFAYSFVEDWRVAEHIVIVNFELKELKLQDGTCIPLRNRMSLNISDGCKHVDNPERAGRQEAYPYLAKKDCRYDAQTNTIRGDIGQLTSEMEILKQS